MSSNTIDSAIRKAIEINARFYSSLGRLTVGYWRELLTAVVESNKARVSPEDSAGTVTTSAPTAFSNPNPAKPAAMVIEAETGSIGIGVFLVENHLDAEVDSRVIASFFKDPSGIAVQPAFTFDPPQVFLKPGEQILVRASIPIGPDLEVGKRYTGEFAVPGLRGRSIPVILCNRGKQ